MKELKSFKEKISEYGSQRIPFVFVIDFEIKKPLIYRLKEATAKGLYYDVKGNTNFLYSDNSNLIPQLHTNSISFAAYRKAFNKVKNHIQKGDSYLLNLTCKTPIKTQASLTEIFEAAHASYKLMLKDEFVLFSPESFIQTKGNEIVTYPMKGTIDASSQNAALHILSDKKELYEHNTIVDLLRNDLSIVADNVQLNRFRYIDRIQSNTGNILQVSSEIKGMLPENWRENIADILLKLLPAGSVSGAPKTKTIQIIQETEKQERGYYTGIFGIFDGTNLDTAVNIRFIEKKDKQLYYRSGGGITAQSEVKKEYEELKQKIYVPIH